MKKLAVLVVVLLLLATIVAQRHRLMLLVIGDGTAPALLAAADEGPDVQWYDDYFTVQELDANTVAIGEPRYNQQNYSYLIKGQNRAVLFDAGPGHRDIRAVAQSLTQLPILFVPSHFHYDHIGTNLSFAQVGVVDLPYLRARADGDQLPLTWQEHLGQAEGFATPVLQVDEWLAPDSLIDLGNRTLRVLHTPGHTQDSISLYDAASNTLFSGDFIYPGPLFAFLPNSNMGDYLQGADNVLAAASAATRIYGAHRVNPPGAPEMSMGDVKALRGVLLAIKNGDASAEGIYPRVYAVNEQMQLLTEPGWLQNWQPNNHL